MHNSGLHQTSSALDYAKAVIDGQQVAGQHVRAACARFMRDLEEDRYLWDPRPLETFERWCTGLTIMDTSSRALGEIPFVMQPWQRFFVGNLLCWTIKDENDHLDRSEGTRRFRQAALFTGKGGGKSTLIAFLAGYLLMDDGYYKDDKFIQSRGFRGYFMGETRPQVVEVGFSVLTNALMDAGVAGDRQTTKDLIVRGGRAPYALFCNSTRGSLEALGTSGTGKGKGGLRPNLVIAEEIGTWRNSVQLDKLTNGFKSALQPLLILLSNPGRKRTGVGWKFREQTRQASILPDGGQETDFMFGMLFENDPSDFRGGKRWWPEKSTWVKSNPTLGTTIRPDYLARAIAGAEDRPYERESVKQLQFGTWAEQGGPLFTSEAWERAQVDEIEPPTTGPCYMGVDLSGTRDMTGVAYVWEDADGKVLARVRHYVQEDSVQARQIGTSQPFTQWIQDGHVIVSGTSMIELGPIQYELTELQEAGNEVYICADDYQRARLCDALGCVPDDIANKGDLLLYTHPKGYGHPAGALELSLHQSIETLIELVDSGRLLLEWNPCTDWNLACAAVPPRADGKLNLINSFPRERKGPPCGNVDGLMALVFAIGLWNGKPAKPVSTAYSAYDDPSFSLYGNRRSA